MNELVIDHNANGIDIALLCDKKLTELQKEDTVTPFKIGDVYLAKVKKTMPNLNAAFLDVGYERDAFLHYTDLGVNVRSVIKLTKILTQGGLKNNSLDEFSLEEPIVKTGKITEVLKKGDIILVQIFKEPIANKGPRVTCDISFAGRYSVLVPFGKSVAVSKKIADPANRKKSKQAADSIKIKNFGIIVRTVAEEAPVEDIESDLKDLHQKWITMVSNCRNAQPPFKVLGEISRMESFLRDLLSDEFSDIHINNADYAKTIKDYILKIAPGKESIVKHYSGKTPIFQHFGIDKQIKSLFGKHVMFNNGAYLIIEHTEAMHVIDVNSGKKANNTDSQQDNAQKINMEAVPEIARQLRLRDLGGIIVVDFIDLKSATARKELYDALVKALKPDRSRHNVLPMSKFGLIQITRERVRPELNINTTELCPSCNGTGKIASSMLLTDTIEEKLVYIWETQNTKNLTLVVNPVIKAYLTKGTLNSIRFKWYWKYKNWIKIKENNQLHLTQFTILNSLNEEIE